MSQNTHVYVFIIILQFNRLQILIMEVTAQSMHGQLRGELGKFENFSALDYLKFYPKLGKVAVIR